MSEALYMENERLVMYVVHREFPGCEGDEDLLQNARLALWNACLSYDPKRGKFSTYAYYAILNEIRRSRCAESKSIENSAETVSLNDYILDENKNPGTSIGERTSNSDESTFQLIEYKKIMDAALDEKERELCDMLVAGMNQQEIAAAYGLSKQAVSKRVQKIRAKLIAYGMLK